MNKKLTHPYLLWAIVIGGGLWWLFGAYRLYILSGFSYQFKATLLSGLPVVAIGGYLLFAIYAAQKRQQSASEAQQERKAKEGVWPPPPSGAV